MRLQRLATAGQRPGLALLAAALLLVGTGAASAAPAAPTPLISYAGLSINGASVPAVVVQLSASMASPIVSVTFSIGNRQVAQTTTIARSGANYVGTAAVDLRGLSGRVTVRAKLVRSTGVSSTVDKTFTAVAPALAPAPPAVATTTAPAATTASPTIAPPPVSTASSSTSAQVTPPVSPTTSASPPSSPTTAMAPDADSTGVRPGVVLTPREGNILVVTDGTVLQDIDLTGCLIIRANNVLISNVRVSCAAPSGLTAVRIETGYSGLVVQDSEIDGLGITQVGIGYSGYTVRRVEIRNTNDGARVSWKTTIEDSWIHDMVRMGDLHPDAIQSSGGTNIVIQHNTLAPGNSSSGDPGNSAVMLGSEQSTQLGNVLVAGNFLSGGNTTVNVRGDTVVLNVVFQDNTFLGGWRYGPMQAPTSVVVTPSNVVSATGLTIVVRPAT